MKITRIAVNAHDYEALYGHMKKALVHLNRNYVGKTKIEIREAIKKLERLRPHLKNKGVR